MANRLVSEKSPYLLQHADNPVNWYPWGEEAFAAAAKDNKPVFLSIGYSTCHWCHVMAHESFEDPEVARLMNESVISVKVDREERPDIDHLYMEVCQMMTGSGGWPLTVVLTPDKRPFFAGTYFPKHSRFGRIGMLELIPRIVDLWNNEKEKIAQSTDQIMDALSRQDHFRSGDGPNTNDIQNATADLLAREDKRYGGFGVAPKFPMPHTLMFLLRSWYRNKAPQTLEAVTRALDAMSAGGIFDHLEGGFHRYSTDASWRLPHFEKMLYDQALMVIVYTEAFQVTRSPGYAETIRKTLDYVETRLTSETGGFFSAEDADSEREEGRFYLWSRNEFNAALGPEEGAFMAQVFDVHDDGNFIEEATGVKNGRNVLVRTMFSRNIDQSDDTIHERIVHNIMKLKQKRSLRVRPHVDDKILTDWNGLMIAACAKAGAVLGESRYLEMAAKAYEFIRTQLTDQSGHLMHRHREGESAIQAYLDDYAFLIFGLIELYQATFEPRYLFDAIRYQEIQNADFWDGEKGGYYLTDQNNKDVLIRAKDAYDGALPSGNGVSMWNALRLSRLTEDSSLEEKADLCFRAFGKTIRSNPAGFSMFMIAADFARAETTEIVAVSALNAQEAAKEIQELRARFLPHITIHVVSINSPNTLLSKLKYLQSILQSDSYGKQVRADSIQYYCCSGGQCHFPTSEIVKVVEFVNRK